MELWIRSQDKEELLKVEEICISVDQDGFVGIWSYGSNKDLKYYLGHYATKERALEVLDEIQNILKPQLLIRRNDDNDKVLLGALQIGVTQKVDMEYKELSTIIYEMPKE